MHPMGAKSEEAYEKEKTRLLSYYGIPSREEQYLVYGTDGFYYPLLSAAGQYRGILYALTDEEERRIMYVNISFCNFYCEIAYEDIIPADVLPVGFDAHKDNPSRRKFEVTDDMESAFSGGGTKLLPQDSSNP